MPKLNRNTDLSKAVGARIKAIRKWRGLSQADFASELDLTRSAVANYEQGRQLPDTMILIGIYRKYNISTDWLLAGNPSGMPTRLTQELLGETSFNLDVHAQKNGTTG